MSGTSRIMSPFRTSGPNAGCAPSKLPWDIIAGSHEESPLLNPRLTETQDFLPCPFARQLPYLDALASFGVEVCAALPPAMYIMPSFLLNSQTPWPTLKMLMYHWIGPLQCLSSLLGSSCCKHATNYVPRASLCTKSGWAAKKALLQV